MVTYPIRTLDWYVWQALWVEPSAPAPACFIHNRETWYPYQVPF
jgi:hypothetical protein